MKNQFLKELAELEAANVITAETAANIKTYYDQQEQDRPNRLGIILGILGALLAGSGVLLIIAHNWDELNKLTRTILSFLPLIIAQALCAYTLKKQSQHRGWIECSATLLFLAIPGCIALISQIYQVGGNLSSFLLTWILLGLPLVYIMNSMVVMLLGIAVATWWAALLGYYDRPQEVPYFYLLTILFLLPKYYTQVRRNAESNWLTMMNLFFGLSFTITLACFTREDNGLYPLLFGLYLLLFSAFYFFASAPGTEQHAVVKRPLYVIGLVGTLVILFSWSFNFLWNDIHVSNVLKIFLYPLVYLLLAGTAINAFIIFRNDALRKDAGNYLPGFSFLPFLLAVIFINTSPSIGILLVNVWILLIAIFYIRRGSRENHFGILNFGLIILGVLAVCRFFDETIPFVWRGIFFLLTGAAFFVSNYYLIRKRKTLTA